MSDEATGLPERLRLAMAMKKFSQTDLAKMLELTPSTVSSVMRGKSQLSALQLAKISIWVQVSADYLLGISDIKQPSISNQDGLVVVGEKNYSVSEVKKKELSGDLIRLQSEVDFLKRDLARADEHIKALQQLVNDKETLIQILRK